MAKANQKGGGKSPSSSASNRKRKALTPQPPVDDSSVAPVEAPPVAAEHSDASDDAIDSWELENLAYKASFGDAEADRELEPLLADEVDEIKWAWSSGSVAQRTLIYMSHGNGPGGGARALRNWQLLARELRARGDSPLTRMAIDRVMAAYVTGGARDLLYQEAIDLGEAPPDFGATLLECHQSFLTALEALKVAESLENPPSRGSERNSQPSIKLPLEIRFDER